MRGASVQIRVSSRMRSYEIFKSRMQGKIGKLKVLVETLGAESSAEAPQALVRGAGGGKEAGGPI